MIFGLERSKTAIYDRIVLKLALGIRACGHECVLVQPEEIKSLPQLFDFYKVCDWVLVTNNNGWLSQKIDGRFLFETLPLRLIFLHHDAILHGAWEIPEISARLQALVAVKDRSVHFSIEKGDVSALAGLGMNSHEIAHINTLGVFPVKANDPAADVEPNVSFIGHAVPPQNVQIAFGLNDARYHTSYRARLADFTHDIRGEFRRTLSGLAPDAALDPQQLAQRVQYLQCCHFYSSFLRGEVLSALKDWRVDLHGGDPAWIHGLEQTRVFPDAHIRHHKPVFSTEPVSDIFARSGINLNITSLQFDRSLINRVIDCTAAGGFILTDRKEQLFELTSCAAAISFSTVDELKEMVAYYIDPAHRSERAQIVAELQRDFKKLCSVEACVERVIAGLD